MKTRAFLILTAALFAFGVRGQSEREVVSAEDLRSGTLPCAFSETGGPVRRDLLWRSNHGGRGCDITVTYHGTERCPAYLEYKSAHLPWPDEGFTGPNFTGGTNYPPTFTHLTNIFISTNSFPAVTNYPFGGWRPVPKRPTTVRAGTNSVTVTLQDVTAVWLVCGDMLLQHHGGCPYTIDEIDCSRSSQQTYPTRTNAAAVFRTQVACGTDRQVVWTAPQLNGKPAICTVTVIMRGTRNCRMTLWTTDPMGNPMGAERVGEQPQCITFHNLNQLSVACAGSGTAGESCTVEIIQTECGK